MTSLTKDLEGYSGAKLRGDVGAGLTVAILAIPQSIAYATIADIDPIYGLYSAIVVVITASLFNSCSRLIHGPTNAICVMIADVEIVHLMDRFAMGPEQFMQVVFLLTLMVGLLQLLGALFRLGYLTTFISPSVIVGFTAGAAALIVIKQLPKILGVDLPDELPVLPFVGAEMNDTMGTLRVLSFSLSSLGEAHWAGVAMAAATTIFVLAYRRLSRRSIDRRPGSFAPTSRLERLMIYVPGPLIAIMIAGVVAFVFGMEESGLQLVTISPGRLPPLSLPLFDLGLIQALFMPALAIALVGLIETVGIARSISSRTREPFNANNQLLSEAIGNVAGAFFSSFAGSSSFTRSALNVEVGATTRLSGIFCGIFVAVFLIFLSPMLGFIPLAALSGVLVAIAVTLLRVRQTIRVARVRWSEAVIVIGTAAWAILFSLDTALLIGVVLSILFYMPYAATLNVRRLLRDRAGLLREAAPDEPTCARLGILDIEGALFFGALPGLEAALSDFSSESKSHKIVRIHNSHHLDASACDELRRFIERERNKNVVVILCGVRPQHIDTLRKAGLLDLLGKENVFIEESLARTSTVQAVSSAYLRIGPHDCPLCSAERADMDTFTYMI